MNALPDDDQRLKELLARVSPSLSDNGFSARVLAALPAKAAAQTFPTRFAVCFIGALAGLALAWNKGVTPDALELAADQLRGSFTRVSPRLMDPAVLVAFAVASLSLLYAFKGDQRNAPKY